MRQIYTIITSQYMVDKGSERSRWGGLGGEGDVDSLIGALDKAWQLARCDV